MHIFIQLNVLVTSFGATLMSLMLLMPYMVRHIMNFTTELNICIDLNLNQYVHIFHSEFQKVKKIKKVEIVEPFSVQI